MKKFWSWFAAVLAAAGVTTGVVIGTGNNNGNVKDTTVVIQQPVDTPKPVESLPIVGIMPASTATLYGALVTRDGFYIDNINDSKYSKNTYERLSSYDTLFLNIRSASKGWTLDTINYANNFTKVCAGTKFIAVADENEEFQQDYHPNTFISQYIPQLRNDANKLPGKVMNGGLTIPIYVWYWSKTHDTDFVRKCMQENVINATILNKFQDKANAQDSELVAMRSMPLYGVNVHYHLSNPNQVTALIRMFNYIKQYTGKDVCSNEVGIWSAVPGCVQAAYDVAKGAKLKCAIYYNGDNSENDYPVSQTDYKNINR